MGIRVMITMMEIRSMMVSLLILVLMLTMMMMVLLNQVRGVFYILTVGVSLSILCLVYQVSLFSLSSSPPG